PTPLCTADDGRPVPRGRERAVEGYVKTREALAPRGPGGLLFGRFRPIRVLHERPGVRTILAADVESKVDVVVKMTETASDDHDIRAGHEALVLSRLDGPYVAPLWDYGHDDGLTYVVTPHIAGVGLDERLRSGPLGVRDAVTLGVCLMRALNGAHDLGVVHR